MRRATKIEIKLGSQVYTIDCRDHDQAQYNFKYALAGALIAEDSNRASGMKYLSIFTGDDRIFEMANTIRDDWLGYRKAWASLKTLKKNFIHFMHSLEEDI